MDFSEYQERALKTFLQTKEWEFAVPYLTLGLNGEAGEVAEKVKKVYRDGGGVITPEAREALVKEMGDVLWYLAVLAHTLEVPLEEVARQNIEKLASRKERGALHGEGDNR
ncbi:MAG: hypothetical protein KatS3mg100_032 [Candidatus Parcubacteria bacterium]|nr:MAG: hypothetical protein KatS3mg100_032 [Candidatus Parcubacteria bacterium]